MGRPKVRQIIPASWPFVRLAFLFVLKDLLPCDDSNARVRALQKVGRPGRGYAHIEGACHDAGEVPKIVHPIGPASIMSRSAAEGPPVRMGRGWLDYKGQEPAR